MPKGASPKEKMTAKMKLIHAKLGKIPQGYTVEPSPKNKFGTVGMPKGMKEEAKKLMKEGRKIMKGRLSEAKRVEEARKKKK